MVLLRPPFLINRKVSAMSTEYCQLLSPYSGFKYKTVFVTAELSDYSFCCLLSVFVVKTTQTSDSTQTMA